MTLRELMTERIHFCVSESELQEFFDMSTSEILTLSDTDFLELYEDVATFPEWDPRVSTMSLN